MEGVRCRGDRCDRGVTRLLGSLTRDLSGLMRNFGGLARALGGDTRLLGGSTESFLILPDFLELLTIAVADLSGFLRKDPELFRVVPGRLGHVAVLFRRGATPLSVLTAVLGARAHSLSVESPLLRREFIIGHLYFS